MNHKKARRAVKRVTADFPIHGIEKDQLQDALDQAIALELATIPTYLYTYYSINRRVNQDELYDTILLALKGDKNEAEREALAKELTMYAVLYANQAAGLIMSVVIEEMLHLALSSNVRQGIFGPPDLRAIAKELKFPAELPGHKPEFPIDLAKLSLKQLTTFLKIESPNRFARCGSHDIEEATVDYTTIGKFYEKIMACIDKYYNGPYTSNRPQLVPSQPYYSQNSINTVHYDAQHKPQFPSADDSGGLIEVVDSDSAIEALKEIVEQGEGNKPGRALKFDKDCNPIPWPVKDGKVVIPRGEWDDPDKQELSHFAKFMELYSLGIHYEEIYKKNGLNDFFSYFVYNKADNPITTDYYPSTTELYQESQMANAIFTYILLMIETCYYQELPTQFEVFMMGIHKSMIWLMSEFGWDMNKMTFILDGTEYNGGVTFEYYPFEDHDGTPKEQLLRLAEDLVETDSTNWGWLFTDPNYLLALPDVDLDHNVIKPMFAS